MISQTMRDNCCGWGIFKRRSPLQNAVAGLLCIHAALLAWSASKQSPSTCEIPQMAAGISNWEFGTFDLHRVNPPLVRMWATLPVIIVGAKTNWDKFQSAPGTRSEFAVGHDFVSANGVRAFWLFTLARWACIPFSVLGAYVCWRWSTEMHGTSAGITTLVLYCFSPDMLAHGQLITTDAAAAALAASACYLFWRWLKTPCWTIALGAGSVLGLAQLTKMTLLILFCLWPLIWMVSLLSQKRLRNGSVQPCREAGQMLFILAFALLVVNLGYGFQGTGIQLRDYRFVSTFLRGSESPKQHNRFADSLVGSIPVPFPESYVLGIDEQKKDFEHFGCPSYLRGQTRNHGWWYFYLYGFCVKTPAALVFVCALALISDFGSPRHCIVDYMAITFPGLAILAFVSSQYGFSVHYRYILPALPFLFVWAGRAAPTAVLAGPKSFAVFLVAMVWFSISSLVTYPHSLSYFSELVGGPRQGHFHLAYSAHDWGQDLLYLETWLRSHPEASPIRLAFHGNFDPRTAGVMAIDVPGRLDLIAGEPR